MLLTLVGLGIWTLIDFLWILVGTFKDKKRASSRKLVTGLLVEGYPNTGGGVTHLSNACPAREDADDDRADGDTTDEFVDFIRVAMQSFGIDPDAWLGGWCFSSRFGVGIFGVGRWS